MAKWQINKDFSKSGYHHQTVEANKYDLEGEYFVFTTNGVKQLSIAAKLVHTIDLVADAK